MERIQCLGGGIDSSLVSSPMPVIGVYIMASTLVCLLLLVCDVLQGLRHRKPWIPCKFFTLNSLTLTLLGIATKLPADLTTLMPRAQDQLSKLCGPLLITISMAFFLPSLADMEGFVLFGNMAALTILVYTVIVNICIQMSTGVIFSFYYAEHIVVLILMLLTLIGMWFVSFAKGSLVLSQNDQRKEIELPLGKTGRLQHNYTVSYIMNPQLAICIPTIYVTYAGMLCFLSLAVMFEALFRTFYSSHLEFCDGESDYKWSMWLIVQTQILTLVLGTLAIIVRSFFIPLRYMMHKSYEMEPSMGLLKFKIFAEVALTWRIYYLPFTFSRIGIRKIFEVIEEFTIYSLFVTYQIMACTDKVAIFVMWSIWKLFPWVANSSGRQNVFDYFVQFATEHVNRLTEKCKTDCPNHLIRLLSSTRPSQELNLDDECNNCLLLVLLVRVASISIPSDISISIGHALDEIFEIVYFISEFIPNGEFSRNFAKELWLTRDLSDHWFHKHVIIPLHKKFSLDDYAEKFVESFAEMAEHFPIVKIKKKEVSLLLSTIVATPFDPPSEVPDRIKQLVVDLMYHFLRQLPSIIEKYVSHSSPADSERRLLIALKIMCKFELLTTHVDWLNTDGSIQLVENNGSPKTSGESVHGRPHVPCGVEGSTRSVEDSASLNTSEEGSQGRSHIPHGDNGSTRAVEDVASHKTSEEGSHGRHTIPHGGNGIKVDTDAAWLQAFLDSKF